MVDTVEENRAQGISPRVDARGSGFLLHVTTGKVSGWLEPKLSRAQVCERNRDVTGESRPSLASRSRLSSCLKSPSPSLSLYPALSPDLLPLPLLLSLYFFSLSLFLSAPSPLPAASDTGDSDSPMLLDRCLLALSYHCNVFIYPLRRLLVSFRLTLREGKRGALS